MKVIKLLVFIAITFSFSHAPFAQANSFTFKKGEVLDILLINEKPGTDSLFKAYVQSAFPVAIGLSYQGLSGYGISEALQGNLHPSNLIIGKWSSIHQREQFLAEIETHIPDFHQQRRDIWSVFNLTYYEIQENITFEINKDKYTVVTAYWQKEATTFATFVEHFKTTSEKAGGTQIIELINGRSPYGYLYKPDYFVITQWESKALFDVFYKQNLKMDTTGVLHINQFVLK